MAKTKTTDSGIRDNLYGIPLNNIYTPEEISDLEKARAERMVKSRRRRNARKQSGKRRFVPPTRKQTAIGVAILSAIILVMLVKTPFIIRVNPRLYIADVIEDTVKAMAKEREGITKSLFGFDALSAPDVSVNFEGNITADSRDLATGFTVKGNGQVSDKNKEASLNSEYSDDGNPFFSMSLYLNEEEAGVNIRELFGEYWTVKTKNYGVKWNNSGFRKALYKDGVSDTADVSYSKLFPLTNILGDKSIKSVRKQVGKAFSASHGEYLGREEYNLNGKAVRCKTFGFDFDGEDLKKRLVAIFDTVLADEVLIGKSDTVYRELFKDVTDFSRHIRDDVVFTNVYLLVGEYDGKIISADLLAEYTSNMTAARVRMRFNLGDTDNICNAIFASVDIEDGSRDVYASISSKGNHSMEGKSFSDKTVLTVAKGVNISEWGIESAVDFKNGVTNARLSKSVNGVQSFADFSGTYQKQGGARFDFDTIDISVIEPTGTRVISANGNLSLVKGVTEGRHNPSGKKYILDMDKADVEAYIRKIEETDRYKLAKEKLDGLFGK